MFIRNENDDDVSEYVDMDCDTNDYNGDRYDYSSDNDLQR